MFGIGLSGAHRTGKTTLARAFSETNSVPFYQTTVSKSFEELGFKPSDVLSALDRIRVQEHLLESCIDVWHKGHQSGQLWITDRTPSCVASYVLGEITGNYLIDPAWVKDYVQRCFDLSLKYFRIMVLVQPGIPLVDEPGKAALNPAYIQHLTLLNSGFFNMLNTQQADCTAVVMPEHLTSIESRLDFLDNVILWGI